ncbi:MAG: hypothetical protein H0W73_14390 [Bacteroidetes bacterium]|nr:hypothetical protein [Bacteroidota bacterium]
MAKVEQLKCPSCGAAEISHISGINYQCDYCHSTFLVKNDHPFSGINFDAKKHTDLKPIPIKPVVTIIAVVIMMAIIGVGASVFYFVGGNKDKPALAFLSDWQKPGVDNYNCLVGSKGAVVWLVLKTQTNKLDSVKYWIRLIDPITKKIISEEPLGEPKAWKELFNQTKLFDSEFYVSNDTAYNISEEGGIQGFALYTGKRLFGNEWLEKRFPQLKTGITKADKELYRNRVKITSAVGDDFYYYLDSQRLLTQKETEDNSGREGFFTEDIYLSQNKKSQLYLCNMKRFSNEGYSVSESYIEQFKNVENRHYFSAYVKDLKLINEEVYPKAIPVTKYHNNLLFFYVSDFSKHANGVLALVNKEGQFAWKNQDTAFKKIVAETTGDNVYLRYNLKNNLIVINMNLAGHQSVGVNLKTGKTQFVFHQPYSLD